MPTNTVNINVSSVGASVLNSSDPSAVTWIRVNADNTVTYRTASQTVSDLAITTTQVTEGTNLYYTDARVRATTLTGLSISGSTIASTDTVLQAFGKLQNQVTAVVGGVNYQGTWNATTNTPALVSSTGTKGYYYVVSVAGSTNLDGITDWKLGDWVIFNGATWEKVDNTDAVISVNGYIGAVTLVKADIGLGNVEDTALSTWAGSTNLVTLGSAITGTGSLTLGTSSSVAGSIVLKNATNAFTQTLRGTNPAASIIYDLPTTAPTAGQVLSASAPSGSVSTLSWVTASSGITIDSTAITGGGANRILFENSANQVSESATNFYFQTASPYAHVFAAGRTGTITGVQNSIFGYEAGKALTTGYSSTIIGYQAGVTLVTQYENTIVGSLAGSGAGTDATYARQNTIMGNSAGLNMKGSQNVVIGSEAGNGEQNYNTVIGWRARFVATSNQDGNTVIGNQSGSAMNGNYNTYIGYLSGFNGVGNYSIALGYNARVTAGKQFVIGYTDSTSCIDNVYFNGVSSTTPQSIILHACHGSGSNVAAANFTLSGGAATGTAAGGYVKTTTSVKRASGSTQQVDTDRNVIPGKYVDITGGAATTFGQLALATSSTTSGGEVMYTIEANDGTDFQSLTGVLKYDVVNKAGTLTVTYSDVQNGAGACSAGTLTATVTATASGTNVLFQANAVSSLAETVLRVSFQVINNFGQAIISAA